MPPDIDQQVLERLDQILRVLALQVAANRSIGEGVWLLKLAGLDNQTIAEVLNTSPESVRTLASIARRQRSGVRRSRVKT